MFVVHFHGDGGQCCVAASRGFDTREAAEKFADKKRNELGHACLDSVSIEWADLRTENERLQVEAVRRDSEVAHLLRGLNDENQRLRAALGELRSYAASVWFDEADASDEEREAMARAKAALVENA